MLFFFLLLCSIKYYMVGFVLFYADLNFKN